MTQGNRWGELVKHEATLSLARYSCRDGYRTSIEEASYTYDVPLYHHGWQMSLVQTKAGPFFVITNRGDMYPASEPGIYLYSQERFPRLKTVATAEEAAAELNLGLLVAVQPCAFESPPPFPKQTEDTFKISFSSFLRTGASSELSVLTNPTTGQTIMVSANDPSVVAWNEHVAKVSQWAWDWGVELAREHMARTHPPFEEARRRMQDAYLIMFTLERYLRTFVEETLQEKYGSDWWQNARIDQSVKEKVERNQSDFRNRWFDAYSPSMLDFAEFDHLASIIVSNWDDFKAKLGGQKSLDWLKLVTSFLVPLRNRVAHARILSWDNFTDFKREANRLIDTVKVHVQPR